ncbi:hypothetical protein [uncultured Tateyamaria sp.]|uniref:hypothetical protein n=2 Tax=uncultured Tateyamaria sp. TaxID=455651 RepID=UPI002628FD17|nr:hypothetical protein [uncultured Tateyamaria sp.]
MKSLLFCSALGLLMAAGCTQYSAPETAQYGNERLQIAAQIEPGMFDGELQLFFNGERVIQQRSQAFGGSAQNFEGRWEGKQVVARATRVQNFMSAYTQIDVFINGTLVETLTV